MVIPSRGVMYEVSLYRIMADNNRRIFIRSGPAATEIFHPFTHDCATTNNVPAGKPTIYLISSSSQYDESIIGEIETVFRRQGYAVDSRYLDQHPTPLGYVNTDDIRAATLIKALTDDNVKYLWFVRGGSGALNLYPYLYRSRYKIAASSPKVLIGFSDVNNPEFIRE